MSLKRLLLSDSNTPISPEKSYKVENIYIQYTMIKKSFVQIKGMKNYVLLQIDSKVLRVDTNQHKTKKLENNANLLRIMS